MTPSKAKAKTNETFIVQASLTIVTYDRQNMFIVQATDSGVRLKQRIRFPLFECLFCRISVLHGASRRGGGGCYDTLAERYGEHIRCFTLTLECPLNFSSSCLKQGWLERGIGFT
jgi:hypothetical protein